MDVLTSLRQVFGLQHSSKIGHLDPVHYYYSDLRKYCT